MENIPEKDQNLDSSPHLSDKSNPKIEYLSQKYPDFPKQDEVSRPIKQLEKNSRMKSAGLKGHKTEKSRSLKQKNKENVRPLSRSKVLVKTGKESKRVDENKETKESKRNTVTAEPQESKKEIKEYLLDLENKIEKQQRKIKNIKQGLEERKNHFQEYAKQLKETKKFEKLIETLESEKQRFEKNEVNFIKSLSEQQKLTKEALNRLYLYQEEGLNEKEQMRQYYECELREKLGGIERKFKDKIKTLKKHNQDLILLQKAQFGKEEGLVNNYEIEIASLKNQMSLQIKENEGLVRENLALKTEIKERREKVETDLNQLKSKMLAENEALLKENEEKIALKQRVTSLVKDLEMKERQTRENEEFYKQQIERLEEKITSLQQKFYQTHENRAKIEELTEMLRQKENEIHQLKSFSQEKNLQKNLNQATQKQQWTKIYSELIEEIQGLKTEIDQLGSENKRLLTSVSHHNFGSENLTFLSSHRLS